MKKKRVVLAAALVSVCGLWWWQSGNEAPAAVATPKKEARRSTSWTFSGSESAPEAAWTLRGRVLDGDAPVEGAEIEATLVDPRAAECAVALMEASCEGEVVRCAGSAPLAHSLSGRDGSFEFEGLEPGHYALRARRGDRLAELVTSEAGVELRLAPGMVPQGDVRDEAGHGVAGAEVQLVERGSSRVFAATVDGEGHFQSAPLPPGEYLAVATAPGLVRARQPLLDDQPTSLVLYTPREVTGRLLGADGAPALGVALTVGGRECRLVTTTGEEGRFRFTRLRPGSYELVSSMPTGAGPGLYQTLYVMPGEDLLDLELGME